MPDVRLISDPLMIEHDPGPGHPERPERLRAVLEALRLRRDVSWRTPVPASAHALCRVHDAAYVDHLLGLRGIVTQLDPDTSLSERSIDAALLGAGAAIQAVDVVLDEGASAWALVRPPGHHAEAAEAMGFCLFNNIAVAAAHAIDVRGLERVMILDWDVHHGNGTQHMFEARSDVFFVSLHQWPFYPGTGAAHEIGTGAGEGFTLNIPLAPDADDEVYLDALRRQVLPAAETFAPQLLLISAGFDAHARDPLGSMHVSDAGFGAMMRAMAPVAKGRVALVLEGGYSIDGLIGGINAVIDALVR